MNKLIISGSSGYIGKNLLSKIDLNRYKVIALTSNRNNLQEFNRIKVIENNDFFKEALDLEGYTLLNLAFARSSEKIDLLEGIDYTYNLVDKFHEYGGREIINVSSQSVYNTKRKEAAKEDDIVYPIGLYGIGKYFVENWLEDYCKKHKIKHTNFRIASVVGPGFEQRITYRLLEQAYENQEIFLNDSGQRLNYLHIDDLISAILTFLDKKPKNWKNIYNLGSNEVYSIIDLGKSIKDLIEENENKKVIMHIKKVKDGYMNNSLSSDRFIIDTGWTSKYKLEDIIESEYYYLKTKKEERY